MPDAPYPKPENPQEHAFRRAFPELADASTAQIRELRAFAWASMRDARREQQRQQAMRQWLDEHQLVLPLADGPP